MNSVCLPFSSGFSPAWRDWEHLSVALVVAALARPEIFFRIYLGGTVLYLSVIGYLAFLTFVAGGAIPFVPCGSDCPCRCRTRERLFRRDARNIDISRCTTRLSQPCPRCAHTLPSAQDRSVFSMLAGWLKRSGVSAALLIISAEGLIALLILWVWSEPLSREDHARFGNAPGATS